MPRVFSLVLSGEILVDWFKIASSLVLPLITRVGLLPLFLLSGSVLGDPTSPPLLLCFLFLRSMIKLWVYTWWVVIPSMVPGHWSLSSGQCPKCATHLAVMPFEPLTFVLVHLLLLSLQSSCTWRGYDPYTVIPFVITDTLYLV